MTTQALLDTYYDGLARRTGWERTIADNFAFAGGSSNNTVGARPPTWRPSIAFAVLLRRSRSKNGSFKATPHA
jgi:hypothetical protein